MTNCNTCNSSSFCQSCLDGYYMAVNNINCVSDCSTSYPGSTTHKNFLKKKFILKFYLFWKIAFNDATNMICKNCSQNCL